ncbi:MAG: hypothetical protein GAK40_00105 [Burkholderia plantarii]|nr:MAG: hypothetical protein GAK40_00105 [Burkholderia plantarii]
MLLETTDTFVVLASAIVLRIPYPFLVESGA